MSTIDDLPTIVATLNKVQSAQQARAAIGATLNALHAAYDGVALYLSGSVASFYTKELDAVRLPLEAWENSIAATGNDDYAATFSQKKNLILAAYNEVAAVEGAAGYTPQTSNWQILAQSIEEAPAVWLQGFNSAVSAVSTAAGKVAAAAGNAAGEALGGVAGGLGLGWILIIVAGVCGYFYLRKGGLLKVVGL